MEMEIVLIEDNDEDAASMIRFLRSNVTNPVRWIQDGAAAAEFLLMDNDAKPKLILLDLVLPSVDGFELFQMIKSEPKEKKLSVIFLISSLKTKEYLESLGMSPDGYLIKSKDEMAPSRVE